MTTELPRARREELRWRYLSLGLGELSAATAFAVVAWAVARPRLNTAEWVTLWWALGPLVLILLQAGTYWLLARSWVGLRPMPTGTATAYRVLRALDAALLAVAFAVILIRGTDGPGSLVLVLAIWGFAGIEFVNYFVVRLAYPSARWLREVGRWRRPRLVQDLRRSPGGRAGGAASG